MVDGSNLATEGRNTPSLAQLDEAVRAFSAERPNDEIIVVVDASFGYRIDEAERKMFEEAEEAGEIVSPPAGAIGRGDGFLLRIADRIDADVLSNDSFQEFHGEYTWLFDEGRLVGGKPVPGVGWIFTPRTPVRGPKSRVATRDADRARKRRAAAPVEVAPEPTAEAIAEATAEAIAPDSPKAPKRGSRRRSRSGTGPEAINEPLPFITFIAGHPLGTEVEGTVEGFTSHGAFVTADGARCYAPVSALGDPPPRSAKEVLKRGEVRTFVIQALDPPRRGIELALPGLAKVAGAPTEETVEAEIDVSAHRVAPAAEGEEQPPAKPRRSRKKAAPEPVAAAQEPQPEPVAEPEPEPAKPRRSRLRKAATPDPEVAAASAEPQPPKKATRSRKKAAEPVVVPEPAGVEPEPPKKATRSRKKAAAVVEPEPQPEAAPQPVKKATRSRKKAAPVVEAEPEPPRKATRSRKKAPPVVEREPEPVKKATRSRKKAAAPAE
ncbi:MAG: NYN domain-containing protein [Acidimicrobiales bacterium]